MKPWLKDTNVLKAIYTIYHPITTFPVDQSVQLGPLRIDINVSDWDRLGRYIYAYMVHIRASGEIFFEQVREFGFREFFLGTIFRFRVSFGTKKKKLKKIFLKICINRLTPLKTMYKPTQSASRSDWDRLKGYTLWWFPHIYIYIYISPNHHVFNRPVGPIGIA